MVADSPLTRRSRELLARSDELLRPRFDVEEWNARRPDPNDQVAWRSWLAELPEEAPLETRFEKLQREAEQERKRKAATREKEREARAKREREALAARPQTVPASATAKAKPVWANPEYSGGAKIVFKWMRDG